jgi:hypothetical protein
MVSESEANNRARRLSSGLYSGEIVIVFQKANGEFDACLEAEFIGDELNVSSKYLDGRLAPE